MNEIAIAEIVELIYGKLRDDNHMCIKDTSAKFGSRTYVRLDAVIEALREYEEAAE